MNERGQSLLIAVLLFVVLMIAIPAVIFINQTSSKHGVASQQKSKGRLIAEEGVAYAMQQLSLGTVVVPPVQTSGSTGGTPSGGNSGEFISQTPIPTVTFPDQFFPASIVMGNTGSTVWSAATYRLGANPFDGTWDIPDLTYRPSGRMILTSDITAPAPATLYGLMQAPPTAGIYQFQWRMFSEGNPPFGAYSPNVTVQVLAAPPAPPQNWPYSGTAMPTPGIIPSAQQGSFDIVYTSYPAQQGLRTYQVGIISRPIDRHNELIPASAVFAAVSPRTVSVRLPTGDSASAALQLTNADATASHVPVYETNANLAVHWGPVVSYGEKPFRMSQWMDSGRSPRKFSVHAIEPCTAFTGCPTGNTYAPTESDPPTDQREYWAFTDLGVPAPIDLLYYQHQAQTNTNVGFTAAAWPTGWSCNNCYHFGDTGYIYVPSGETLTIDGDPGASADWSFTSPNGVLYIDGGSVGGGNVRIKNVRIDLKNRGAIIVTGHLEIGERRDNSGLSIATAPVPDTAALENPYASSFLCPGSVSQDCDVSATWATGAQRPSIRGFTYALKDMTISDHETGATGHILTLVGTVRVDGKLTIRQNATLAVFMDAEINRAIRTANFGLQIDSIRPIN